MRRAAFVIALAWALAPRAARADDAGADATDDAEDAALEGIQPTTTGDNWNCGLARTRPRGHDALLGFGLGTAFLIRRRRRAIAVAAAAAVSVPVSAFGDEPPPPVDATVAEEEPAMRRFAIEINPLSLIVDRYGASIEVLLASHHALELGGYYVYSATNSDSSNIFRGGGGEVGYRFYLGRNGFRGFYIGPSFLLAALDAVPQNGPTISYFNVGGALDAGWQALVADRVLVGLGAGVQYTTATQTFPQQQLSASVYANAGVRPRVSISLGVAF